MKILMVNTPDSQGYKGGDLTQMRMTARALAPHGVTVHESFEMVPDPTGYDIAHVFNVRTVRTTTSQVTALKKHGIPVAMSPIYLNPSRALWATRVIKNIFGRPRPEPELASLLRRFATYDMEVVNDGGLRWSASSQNRARPDYDDMQRAILKNVDHLLPNSYLEADALVKTLRVTTIPFTVVPYGVDPAVFADPDPAPFVAKHGIRDFVLQVARVEPLKNQVMLLRAMKDVDLPVVLIGGHHNAEYLRWCRSVGVKRLTILPHIPPEELRSAYAAARVHVLPSWFESCGLVTMEAALAGCNVVTACAGYELEYYESLAYYCDPGNTASIRDVVLAAHRNHPDDGPRREKLRKRILEQFSWEVAARRTLEAYHTMLGD